MQTAFKIAHMANNYVCPKQNRNKHTTGEHTGKEN